MKVEYSLAYGSQSNGADERPIQEFWTTAHTVLLDSKLRETLWAEAISHASYLHNRLQSERIGMKFLTKVISSRA